MMKPQLKATTANELEPYLHCLQERFKKQLGQAGQTRNWANGYIAALVRTYRKLRRKSPKGRRLTSLLGKRKQAVLLRLITLTTDRDTKVRSRWAKAARLALVEKIDSADVPNWLTKGGGIAGRASEASHGEND